MRTITSIDSTDAANVKVTTTRTGLEWDKPRVYLVQRAAARWPLDPTFNIIDDQGRHRMNTATVAAAFEELLGLDFDTCEECDGYGYESQGEGYECTECGGDGTL